MNDPCETRRRATARQWAPSTQYVRALDAVNFHVQALRYRAGLSHTLNEEEQQLVRHARRAVEQFMSGRHHRNGRRAAPADWIDTWMTDANPAMLQAVAIELQWQHEGEAALAEA